VGFIDFLSGFFKKTGVFLFGSNHINTENSYRRLIDFQSHISKLYYFNVLDLADFIMHY